MHADIKGALEFINSKPFFNLQFEHKGMMLSNIQTIKVLEYGLNKGYKTTDELSDDEVDDVLSQHFALTAKR